MSSVLSWLRWHSMFWLLTLATCLWGLPTAARAQPEPASSQVVTTAAQADADQAQIRQLLNHTWHQVQKPLRIGPLVVQGNLAVADWWWQGKGGRAVLKKRANQWKIVFCGGAGVKQPALYAGLGLTEAATAALLNSLQQAESTLSAADVRLLDSFGATVTLDTDPHHGSSHHSNHY